MLDKIYLPWIRVFFFSVLLAIATRAFTGTKPLHAFVSVAPQRNFVQRIAGALAQVEVLVKPGQDPHTFEPTARLIAKLAAADVYLRIGVPFENTWISRVQAINPHMEILDLSAGLNLPQAKYIATMPKNRPYHEDHEGLDPHLWTSPPLVRRMGLRLRDYLMQRDPSNSPRYQVNYATFNKDLDELEQDIHTVLAKVHVPCRFMVFHPAWGHFAAAYSLTQIAIEHNGKAPGAKTLGDLVNQAQKWKIQVIFMQPQFDHKTAQTLASAIGGKIEILDPLVEDYFSNLRQVASQIARSCYQ